MQDLVQGVCHFQKTGFREQEELFARLKDGQHPQACFITCADSRIVPSLITNTAPGDLFLVRNVGNIVPCYGTSNNAEMAAVEYAIVGLGIEDVIVCGHTGCGAMQALLDPSTRQDSSRLPCVSAWLGHADATREIVQTHYGHLEGQALIDAAAEENVLVQLEHLRSLPAIAAAISSGKVRVHGWMYNIGTGEIFYYDPDVSQFVKFGASPEDAAARGMSNSMARR